MVILQWIIVGVLVYALYYLINKYERKVDELTRLIELNREEIARNKENIKRNKEGVEANRAHIENSLKVSSKSKKPLDLNQDMIEKLK